MRVYFDNASTTPLLDEVKQVMKDIVDNQYGNPSSIHQPGRKSKTLIEDARSIIANGLNASTGEIFFTSCATESNNMALLCSVRDLGIKRIISSPTEHHCILHTLDYLENSNLAEIVYLDVDNNGHINHTQLDQLLAEFHEPQMVALMHVNNEIGTIHNIEAISEICIKNKALFLCDGAQSVGKLPIDVNRTPMSFLSGSSHKFFGPKGCGFIYINNDNLIKPLVYGGDQERGMRSGTENIYGICGMAKAFECALRDMDIRKEKISDIKSYCMSELERNFEDIQFNGSPVSTLYNILSVSFPHSDTIDMIMMNMDINGICASAGSACSSGVENDSHVLQHIGHDPARKTVRFSFSHFNTRDEVDYLISKLKKFIAVSN